MNSSSSENYFDLIESLTPRELSILRLLGEHQSNKEISAQLHLSINTVKWYARQIFGKLGVDNRRQAIKRAQILGILKKNSEEFIQQPITYAQGNLPSPLTPFIGRDDELTYLTSILTQPSTRLVTLIGPGGIGKTRLAIETACRLQKKFADGIWLVNMGMETNPDLVPQYIASTLGITYYKKANVQTSLIHSLRDKQILLILDNLEHLVDSCSWYVEDMLHNCYKLVILATSRRPLKVSGEIRYLVQALYAPDPTKVDCSDLAQADAIQLFVSRAKNLDRDFILTKDNLPEVAQICHRLDGIPLAVELAAGRTNALTTEDILAHLDERFSLLTGGPKSTSTRYQALQTSMDWSYYFLSLPEILLFQRLAIFKGSWSLKATEAICSGEGLESWQITDCLSSLVDQSLVGVEPIDLHNYRYFMLETIHQYALNKLLDTGDHDYYSMRHLSYFHKACEEIVQRLRTGEKSALLKHLSLDKDNLIGAINWALDINHLDASNDRIQLGLDLTAWLQDLWKIHNLYPLAEKWLKIGLSSLPAGRESSITRGKAFLVLYKMVTSWTGGDYQEYLDESIKLLRQTTDYIDLAEAIGYKASHTLFHGKNIELARQLAEESLAFAKQSEDDWIIASSLHLMAGICVAEGNVKTARAYAFESERLVISTGDLSQVWIYRFGESLLQFPEPEPTRTSLFKALKICRDHSDIENEILVLFNIADITYVEKDFKSMQTQFQYCLDRSRDFGMMVRVSWGLRHTGTAWKYLGNIKEAANLFYESLQISQKEGFKTEITFALTQLAGLASLIGKPELCILLLGFASTLHGFRYEGYGIDSIELRVDTEFARSLLDEQDFNQSWDRGKELPYEIALAEATSLFHEIQAPNQTTSGYEEFIMWYKNRPDEYATLTPLVSEDNILS